MMDAAGGPYHTCVSTLRIPRCSRSGFRAARYFSASATTSICAMIGSAPGSTCASAARSRMTTPSGATRSSASARAVSASFEPSSGTRILLVFIGGLLAGRWVQRQCQQEPDEKHGLGSAVRARVRRRLPGGSGPPRPPAGPALTANLVLVDQPVERLAVDAGGLRGGGHVAVVAGEQIPEVRDLEDLQPLILGLPEGEIGPGGDRRGQGR